MNKPKITYSSSGVDYSSVDPLKKLAQNLARSTSEKSEIKVVESSRGESAFVWEEDDSYRAFVIEGLGTKNLIADKLREQTGKTYYDLLAQDTLAMILNDLIVVGAKPQVVNAYFAAGSSAWFEDSERSKDLSEGWANVCKKVGVVWGGGESPILDQIINSQTAELAGSAIGIIKPKGRLTLGDKLQYGDTILLIESSGIHSNGLTLARKVADQLTDGYLTKLSDGKTFGESLLTPTHIYVNIVQKLFEAGIDIHYMVNITGHGWRKIMRANKDFTYHINETPPVPPIFDFIQKESESSDEDMYGYLNMGAGFAIFLPKDQAEKAQQIIIENSFKSWISGEIKEGERKVIIEPKNITFEGKSLDLR